MLFRIVMGDRTNRLCKYGQDRSGLYMVGPIVKLAFGKRFLERFFSFLIGVQII